MGYDSGIPKGPYSIPDPSEFIPIDGNQKPLFLEEPSDTPQEMDPVAYPDDTDGLIQLLSDDREFVRRNAVQKLSKLDDRKSILPLIDLLERELSERALYEQLIEDIAIALGKMPDLMGLRALQEVDQKIINKDLIRDRSDRIVPPGGYKAASGKLVDTIREQIQVIDQAVNNSTKIHVINETDQDELPVPKGKRQSVTPPKRPRVPQKPRIPKKSSTTSRKAKRVTDTQIPETHNDKLILGNQPITTENIAVEKPSTQLEKPPQVPEQPRSDIITPTKIQKPPETQQPEVKQNWKPSEDYKWKIPDEEVEPLNIPPPQRPPPVPEQYKKEYANIPPDKPQTDNKRDDGQQGTDNTHEVQADIPPKKKGFFEKILGIFK